MNLEDAMFLWMPVDDDLYRGNPRQGRLIVVQRGQNDAEYPMSAGACDLDWNEAESHAARVALLQEHVSEMIWNNGVSREAVLAALAQIDDINPLQLNLDQRPN